MRAPTAVSGVGRVRVRDGRTVVTTDCGDPSGDVVFYLHGFPSSRLEGMLHADAASRAGVRLVAMDRPGYGRSSPFAGAMITDVARDVLDVADALRVTTFGVVGVSGGAAYAIACAALGADRVRRVALVAPLGPPNGPRFGMRPGNKRLLGLAARFPAVFGGAQPLVGALIRRRTERVIERFARTLPQNEQLMVADPALRAAFADVLRESFAQRGKGAAGDGPRLARPWDVDPRSVAAATRVWHGLLDDIVPSGLGADLAARMGAELTLLPDEGHFSIVRNRMEDVLRWTVADERDSGSPG